MKKIRLIHAFLLISLTGTLSAGDVTLSTSEQMAMAYCSTNATYSNSAVIMAQTTPVVATVNTSRMLQNNIEVAADKDLDQAANPGIPAISVGVALSALAIRVSLSR